MPVCNRLLNGYAATGLLLIMMVSMVLLVNKPSAPMKADFFIMTDMSSLLSLSPKSLRRFMKRTLFVNMLWSG